MDCKERKPHAQGRCLTKVKYYLFELSLTAIWILL